MNKKNIQTVKIKDSTSMQILLYTQICLNRENSYSNCYHFKVKPLKSPMIFVKLNNHYDDVFNNNYTGHNVQVF